MVLSFAKPWMVVFFAVAALWIVPAAFLLAFGDRPEVPVSVPVVTLVSEPVAADCVMFCADPPTATTTPSPDDLCPPFCEFERW